MRLFFSYLVLAFLIVYMLSMGASMAGYYCAGRHIIGYSTGPIYASNTDLAIFATALLSFPWSIIIAFIISHASPSYQDALFLLYGFAGALNSYFIFILYRFLRPK